MAWTHPEHLKRWFTPAPWTTVDCEIDLRPGGIFRTTMRSPDGRRVIVSSTAKGKRTVDAIMPVFNEHESTVTSALSAAERREMSRLLRAVLRTLDAETD